MLLDGFFETLNEFTEIIKKKFRNIYQNSSLYEKKFLKLLIMSSYTNQVLTYFHR